MEIINLKSGAPESSSAPIFKKPKNQVTDLKQGVHDENRINVFVDGEFSFSLELAQVVDYHIKIGKVLTNTEIKELKHASVFGKLYSQTLEWVLMRPRSIKETRDHLKQRMIKLEIDNRRRAENRERIKTDIALKKLAKDHKIKIKARDTFEENDIELVVKRLQEKGYLDDRKFAAWFIENRFERKGVSERRLRQELLTKGIEQGLIEELLESSPRNEAEEIQKVIQKKGPKSDPQKLLGFLMRHGFSYEHSREQVEKYYGEQDLLA